MLYLVRHGAIQTKGRRYLGQMEVPLDEEGIRQAANLGILLRDVRFRRIYSSDLARAQRTAEMIAGGRDLEIRACREFREIDLGEWDGCALADVMQRFPQAYKARGEDLEHFRPPGGESFGDVRDRVLPALHDALEAADGDVLLVAHRAVNRVILCDVLGLPLSNILRIRQDYGCLNILASEAAGCHVKLLNYSPRVMTTERDLPAPKLEVSWR
jgi:alpha-ribazole phosphatase